MLNKTDYALITALNENGRASQRELASSTEVALGTVSNHLKNLESENIIRALRMARSKECHLMTFSGFAADNPSRLMGDINFYVPSSDYVYVETAHTALLHYLTTRSSPIPDASNSGSHR